MACTWYDNWNMRRFDIRKILLLSRERIGIREAIRVGGQCLMKPMDMILRTMRI